MATATKTAPTLAKSNSHSVREDNNRSDGISKEEVFLYYLTDWRGQPCRVTMHLDRYRASYWENDKPAGTKLTPWRAFAETVRTYDPENPNSYGSELTDTARRRLSDEILPLALAWLETEAYTVSESLAYAHMILDTRENDRYGSTTRNIRRQAEQYRDKLPTGVRNRLLEIADSYEALNRQRDNLSSMLESVAS
jgi:hypothetical protein